MAPKTMPDLHPQDWLLIIEGLVTLSRDLDERGIEPERSERARELITIIAEEQGLDSVESVKQVDSDWNGESDHLS